MAGAGPRWTGDQHYLVVFHLAVAKQVFRSN
jgi:hypothetical protein